MPAGTARKGHSALVRATHWLTTLAFLALLRITRSLTESGTAVAVFYCASCTRIGTE